VPILQLANDKDDFEFVGTGVYIRRQDRHFVATANHVIHKIEPRRVLLLTSIDRASSIPARSCISRNDDKADIALYELLEPLHHFSPLAYDNVQPLTDEDSVVYMLGIPATRVSRRSRQRIDFERRTVITRILRDGGQHFDQFDPQVNFVCDFKKEQVLNGNGQVVTFPDPYGMSGGPAFQPFYSEANALVGYSLVGIMTEWNPKKKRFIRCTKAQVLLFMIDSLWIT
jgi:hypothetical protein